jgi:cobalt transporter subunit CbtA
MLRRIFLTAVLAGAIGGLAVTLLQSFATTPLIQAAEGFEAAVELGHQQEGAAAWAPASGLERLASGFLANLLIAIGFAALLAAAFTLAGAPKGWGTALLWGLAGFAAFALLPALGLPPELPGMVAAELTGR